MDELNNTAQVTSDPVTQTTGAVDPARQAILDKYQTTYGQDVTQTVTTPDQVVEPVTIAPVTVAPDPVAQLQAELAQLKQQLAEVRKPEPVVTEPPTADWLQLLAEGKKAEGEKAIAEFVKNQIDLNKVQQDAVQQAIAAVNAERDISNFVSQVRNAPENADVLIMEPYITGQVERRIAEAQASGTIKTTADYVKVYKDSVNAELEIARKLALSIRGQGKQEAQVRNQQVLSNQTLMPNPVNTSRGEQQTNNEVVETAESYLAKRMAAQAARHGLNV